jgi:apolipoprotein N-acyltransferase
VCEYVRSNLFFLSFPWNLLGHSQHDYLIFIQIANITGVYGVSFLIIMVNQFLSQMPDLLRKQKNDWNGRTWNLSGFAWAIQSLAVILLLATTILYGWKETRIPGAGHHLRIAIVQPNLVTRDDMTPQEQATHLHTYEQLSLEAARKKPDLIVWPASSLPAPISSLVVRFYIMRLSIRTKGYLLVGGSGREKDRSKKEGDLPYSNSEFLVSPSGKVMEQYNKIRLLPFNEYLPLKGLIHWPEWITSMKEGFIPGDKYTVFEVPGARFGAPICWENMFPGLFRRFVKDGAQFMVSATNEAFLGKNTALQQSLAINIFRAVENRVAIVRAATAGVSCFIDPDGRVVERVTDGNGRDLFVSGMLVRDVSLASKKTFYTNHGDLFAYLIMGISGFSILAVMFRKNQT